MGRRVRCRQPWTLHLLWLYTLGASPWAWRRRPDSFTRLSPPLLIRYVCASDTALLDMDLGDDPVFHVGDWVEVMRLDGDDVRYGRIVACWARLSPAELCGFETWYRIDFGPDESVVRNEMDVPDTEIVDGLP